MPVADRIKPSICIDHWSFGDISAKSMIPFAQFVLMCNRTIDRNRTESPGLMKFLNWMFLHDMRLRKDFEYDIKDEASTARMSSNVLQLTG